MGRFVRRRRFLATGAVLAAGARPARAATAVDLLLVMAVDISRSVDDEEAQLQRDGYRMALTDPEVLAAMTGGPNGAVAVAYVEWASYQYQRLVVPWTRIAGAGDATAWSDALGRSPHESITWTSLSGALLFSRKTLSECPFESDRKVIDVSGDGRNNNGPEPEEIRDQLVSEGVTINGLPILNLHPRFGRIEYGLEEYYRNSVIGGAGAFLILAKDFADFGKAIRRKLIQEIAGRAPLPADGARLS